MPEQLMIDFNTWQRFWKKVKIDKLTNCWNWEAYKLPEGYGVFHKGRKFGLVLSHRFSYEMKKQIIPNGLDIDHLCRNKSCVNPDHLETVTRKENLKRAFIGIRMSMRLRERTHCKQGHVLLGKNLYLTPDNRRQCKICINERSRKSYIKKKGVIINP